MEEESGQNWNVTKQKKKIETIHKVVPYFEQKEEKYLRACKWVRLFNQKDWAVFEAESHALKRLRNNR